MKRALLIPAGGKPEEVEIPDKDELDTLQQLVGGWIEYVPTEQDVTLYCNEEGKLQNLPPNSLATAIFGKLLMPHDFLAGDVVVCGPLDEEGYSLPLSEEVVADVRAAMLTGVF